MPVYRDGHLIGLLTTDTIARWLGIKFSDIEIVDEASVEEVLSFAEDKETYRLVPRSIDVFEALELFSATQTEGRRLDAVIVTHNGRASEQPLGLMTVADIPIVLRSARFGR